MEIMGAMKQALEALEQLQGGCTDSDDGTVEAITVWCPEVIDALRQAIEQAEQAQPVAWISEGGDVSRSKRYMDEMGFKCNPLYTAPPKQWVGLTDDEVSDVIDNVLEGGGWLDVARALEVAIKRKNA